jgi:hypothetical protein
LDGRTIARGLALAALVGATAACFGSTGVRCRAGRCVADVVFAERGPGPGVADDVLRAAVDARAPQGTPPSQLRGVWRWRPEPERELLVWITCRGDGESRACAVSVGEPRGATAVRLLSTELVGWSVPRVGEAAVRWEVWIEGYDGRGAWQQALRFLADNGGTIAIGRRRYQDGL